MRTIYDFDTRSIISLFALSRQTTEPFPTHIDLCLSRCLHKCALSFFWLLDMQLIENGMHACSQNNEWEQMVSRTETSPPVDYLYDGVMIEILPLPFVVAVAVDDDVNDDYEYDGDCWCLMGMREDK